MTAWIHAWYLGAGTLLHEDRPRAGPSQTITYFSPWNVRHIVHVTGEETVAQLKWLPASGPRPRCLQAPCRGHVPRTAAWRREAESLWRKPGELAHPSADHGKLKLHASHQFDSNFFLYLHIMNGSWYLPELYSNLNIILFNTSVWIWKVADGPLENKWKSSIYNHGWISDNSTPNETICQYDKPSPRHVINTGAFSLTPPSPLYHWAEISLKRWL